MNIHKNARTCPRSRALLVRRVLEEGESPKEAAASFGVSERTVYKWLARWRAEGPAGLLDRPSRPRRIPRRLPEGWVGLIARLRRHRMTGAQIAHSLGLPRSTVAAHLGRLGLGRLQALDPPEPARRYERTRPGELVHIDVKKLGRVGRIGHRITGDRSRRARGVGWEFVHICLDDYSRLAYVEVLADERKESATGFLLRAAAWFRARGIRLERVMTDNGPAYLSRAFARTCGGLGVRHLRTKPYTPRTNGKAERFIQTLLREWAYAWPYPRSSLRTSALARWLDHYNHRRPHGSLGAKPPISRLQPAA